MKKVCLQVFGFMKINCLSINLAYRACGWFQIPVPFNQYSTNIDDKTVDNEIQSYSRYLSRKFLYLNWSIRFKSRFRIREPHCVKSYFSVNSILKGQNKLNSSTNSLFRDGRTRSTVPTNTICRCIHSILPKIQRKKAIVMSSSSSLWFFALLETRFKKNLFSLYFNWAKIIE